MSYVKSWKVTLWFMVIGLLLIIAGVRTTADGAAAEPEQTGEPLLPPVPFDYVSYADVEPPDYFFAEPISSTNNTPPENPITNEGATLGRVLFYDVRLSANETTSCASCHLQQHGFSDPRQFSVGFEGGLTDRNSPGLANNRYYARGHFFYDERADTLEDQALMPIQDPIEMGMELDDLVVRLEGTSFYPPLFEAAFGTTEINTLLIQQALAQFMRAMVSYQSRYDVAVQQGINTLTPEEQLGLSIFSSPQGNCIQCHMTDIQITDEPRNIGLDVEYADQGVGEITLDPADNGKFKVPSLRNIGLTAPYMHDGRFATLEEVVEFYDSEVQPHPNLDPLMQDGNGNPRRLDLENFEKEALVAFMETLTDYGLVNHEHFSDPFAPDLFLPALSRP